MDSRQEDDACPVPRYAAGDRIGDRYVLERPIGAGSMGTVWVASHEGLQRRVAIKLLRSELHAPGMLPVLAERLIREARAAARIHHPSVVRVFDFGVTSRGDPFVVMELLQGEGLRAILQREKRLHPRRAVALVLPLAAGLEAAHARGIVHRDLKPDNIVVAVDDSGRACPKVLDFGVAKFTFPAQRGPALTGCGLIGTPEYMAPEQALALDGVDHRADVWSLCVCLYELIGGRVPFPGNCFEQILRPVVQDPAPELRHVPGVDAPLWGILERGLEKNVEDRWQSMRELGENLASWLASQGVEEDVTGASLRTHWLAPLAVVHPPRPDASPGPVPAPAPVSAHAATLAVPLIHKTPPAVQSAQPRWRASTHAVSITAGAAAAWFAVMTGLASDHLTSAPVALAAQPAAAPAPAVAVAANAVAAPSVPRVTPAAPLPMPAEPQTATAAEAEVKARPSAGGDHKPSQRLRVVRWVVPANVTRPPADPAADEPAYDPDPPAAAAGGSPPPASPSANPSQDDEDKCPYGCESPEDLYEDRVP